MNDRTRDIEKELAASGCKPLMTKKEVALALRRSLRTIDRYRASGAIAAVKVIGTGWPLFRRSSVARLVSGG